MEVIEPGDNQSVIMQEEVQHFITSLIISLMRDHIWAVKAPTMMLKYSIHITLNTWWKTFYTCLI